MKTLQFFKQILLNIERDIRSNHLTLLGSCLIVAVAATTAVGFFTERIEKAIRVQSNELLAADLRVSSNALIPPKIEADALRLKLDTAHYVKFSAMIVHDEGFALAEIKAVESVYPLRGKLRAISLHNPLEQQTDIPKVDEVFLDAVLMAKLEVSLGGTITLGNHAFTVAKQLTFEPDRGGDLFNVSPRILMNVDDIEKTGLVVAGSRVIYTSLFAGSERDIEQFRTILPKDEALRIQSIKDAEPTLKVTLERAERFMSLASMIALLIAACGIALSAHEFAKSRIDMVAIMRTFGVTKRYIAWFFGCSLLLIALICGIVGVAIAYGVQSLIIYQLGNLFIQTALPSVSLKPAFMGVLVSILVTLGFALPSFYHLRNISPMRVLRNDLKEKKAKIVVAYFPAFIIILFLSIMQAGSLKLGLLFLLGFLITLLMLSAGAYLLLHLIRYLPNIPALYLGRKNIQFRKDSTLLQVVVIGFGLVVMMLLVLVRTDLINYWRLSVPKNAPNQFAINIPEHSVPQVKAWLANEGVKEMQLYPMFAGRIVKHNGAIFSSENFADPDIARLARRQYNLSWSEAVPPANKVVAGVYAPSEQTDLPEISIEDKLAERFGFKLGDTVTFLINGSEVTTKINSERTIDWQSVQANFFILFYEDPFKDTQKTWMTAFYWPNDTTIKLLELIKEVPELTLIDVGEIIKRIHELIEKVTLAVSFILGFSLFAGLLVLIVVIQSTKAARITEIALYRTLGLKARVIKQGLISEFALIGALSGLLAGGIAIGLSFVTIWFLFDLIAEINYWMIILGMVFGSTMVGAIGFISTRRTINISPMQIMRSL